MRKAILALCVVVVLSFLSCGGGAGGDSPKLVAPDMGSASAITASGATYAPANETDAVSLLSDSITGLKSSSAFSSVGSGLVSSPKSKALAAKASGDTHTPISIHQPGLDVTGTVDETTTGNYTSDPIDAVMKVAMAYTAVVTNLSVTGSASYTVNGKENLDETVTVRMYGSNPNYAIDLGFTVKYGLAMSVKRVSDGLGAKFLLLVAGSDSIKNLTSSSLDSLGALNISGVLTVYDDSNKLLFTKTLTMAQLSAIMGTSAL